VGIVFPVYHKGLPLIVSRFVQKLSSLEQKYVFGVCTYGDSPGISLKYLDRLIRSNGGMLAAGFAVRMPYNYITPSPVVRNFYKSFILRQIPLEDRQNMYAEWESRLSGICRHILAKGTNRLEMKAKIVEHLVDSLNLRETLQKRMWLKIGGFHGKTDLPFLESRQLMDNAFQSDDKCSGCGTCARLCPVGDIELTDGRPVWRHNCEQCFACLHWCPNAAIQFGTGTTNGKRYHHPGVKLSDMMSNGESLQHKTKNGVETK
jgi:ferredoxin